ncbi:hypothetical protein QBC44DRAFT_306922 [Cladorrhinum sp. PSN332]|nr:hypothetical protein QBC44DRAFT_306922 [Cladorrhinum sp. PSN332]
MLFSRMNLGKKTPVKMRNVELNRRHVDSTFAANFEAATRFKKEDAVKNVLQFEGPLQFLVAVYGHEAMAPLTGLITFKRFVRLFLTLRGARAAWNECPRQPASPEAHCLLAKRIDELEAVDNTNWGDLTMMEWAIESFDGMVEDDG